jgi:hypothetical protein
MTLSKLRIAAFAVVFAIVFMSIGAGIAWAAQSHMISARNDLQAALGQLEQAETNKGGHRVNAINYTRNAINEVNLGIQYAQ